MLSLSLPLLLPPWKHVARRQPSAHQEVESSQGPRLQHLLWDFPASRPVRKCLFKPPSLGYSVTTARVKTGNNCKRFSVEAGKQLSWPFPCHDATGSSQTEMCVADLFWNSDNTMVVRLYIDSGVGTSLGHKGTRAPRSKGPKQLRCASSLPVKSKGRERVAMKQEKDILQWGQHREESRVTSQRISPKYWKYFQVCLSKMWGSGEQWSSGHQRRWLGSITGSCWPKAVPASGGGSVGSHRRMLSLCGAICHS